MAIGTAPLLINYYKLEIGAVPELSIKNRCAIIMVVQGQIEKLPDGSYYLCYGDFLLLSKGLVRAGF